MNKIFYGWVIVGVTFLIGATEAGAFQNILSVFLKPMTETFGWSRAAVSGTMAFGSICAGIIAPFFGPILDRHGPRLVAFGAVLVLSAGLVSIAFINHIWQLYLFFGVGRMVAVGILSLVITVSISNWFVRLRGRAMGIAWLGPRVGTAVLPALAQYFILTQGWRFAWAGLGVVVFLMSGIPALFFLRRKPEDFGLLPDGDRVDSGTGPGGNPTVSGSGTKPIWVSESDPVWTRKQAARSSAFWMLTAINSLYPLIQAGTNFHLFPFMTDQGMSETRAIVLISSFAIFGSLGAVSCGFLAERFSPKLLLTINGFASGVVFFGFFTAVNAGVIEGGGFTLLMALTAVHGILHGGRMPLFSIIWAEYFGRSSLGSIYSFSSPFRFTANAVGPIFAALFFDTTGSYSIPFHLFTVLFLIAGIISFYMKPPRHPSQPA